MSIFIGAGFIGMLFVFLSFILSLSSGAENGDTGEGGGDVDIGLVFVTFAPNMLAVAFIGFGVGGELFMRAGDVSQWVALVPALLLGYGLMFAVNNYIYLPLVRISSRNKAVNAKNYEGQLVTITENIRGDGLGSVTGLSKKQIFTYAAKSSDGEDILAGDTAVVLSVEDGFMVVKKTMNEI